jgi:hypothetical protein
MARRRPMQPGMMNPDMTDEDMVFPPGMQEGQGMDDENPYLQDESMMGIPGQSARAMPVHDTGQMQSEYRRMGMRVPQGMQQITGAFERQPGGPIKEQLHSAQHQMMLNDQNTVNQTKRMEMAAKKTMIQQKIMALQRAGRMNDAAKLQNSLDMLMNQLDAASGAIPE